MIKFVIFVLTILISKSFQQQPSISCVTDSSPFISFYSNPYGQSGRFKCTFFNINSNDDINNLLKNSPQYNTQSILSMAFNQSNLSAFPDRMFTAYANLRSLDGSNLRLTDISSNAFSGMKSLDYINLKFNNLTSILSKVFGNIKIKSLDLSYNLISSINANAFMGSEIDKIDLSHNKIKDTMFIGSFKFFNYLQMNDNEIQKIEKLNFMEWNPQREVYFTPQFPSINLQSNKIQTFDCSSSIKLVLIDLKNNRELNKVNLNQCAIDRLDVSECSNLENFKIRDNLVGLTAKNVFFKQIDFNESNSLRSLVLVNNSLNSEIIQAITRIENLTSLELSYNNIGPLNISTFAKLKNLMSLSLKSTNISNIGFGTFSHQNNVRELDISDNNLGFFDMHMIFTMNSLISLDISGNELSELDNIESAHTTFAVLDKIDLTNNKWPCKYLMRLMKIMKVYRVTLVQSSVEEHKSNINGIYCKHFEGDESLIEPLSPDSNNITDIREKMNEIVNELSKHTQFRNNIEIRVSSMEEKIDKQMNIMTTNSALHSPSPSLDNIEVKNSFLLDFSLILICICFTIFMTMQIIFHVRKNFLNRPKPMRAGISDNTLIMNQDEF